jgi:hypothetical protein
MYVPMGISLFLFYLVFAPSNLTPRFLHICTHHISEQKITISSRKVDEREEYEKICTCIDATPHTLSGPRAMLDLKTTMT